MTYNVLKTFKYEDKECRKDWVFKYVSGGERNYEGKYSCC